MSKPVSRRAFLRQFNCAAVGYSAVLNSLVNLKLANSLSAQSAPDNKALVCIFLNGGCDAFNLLVPSDPSAYAIYSTGRGTFGTDGGLALDRNSLLPLSMPSNAYGLHPSCVNLQQMANGTGAFSGKRRLAFIANVGTLIQPITKAQFNAWENGQNNSLPVPRSLLSHLDQVIQWQTAIPQGMSQLSGWAGRAADILNNSYNNNSAFMSISLTGTNVLQVGNQTQPFTLSAGQELRFTGDTWGAAENPLLIKNTALRGILDQQYTNILTQSFATITKQADLNQQTLQQQFSSAGTLPPAIDALFPATDLGAMLKTVVQTLQVRSLLGVRRQTFFINYGGWDHHTDLLLREAAMLGILDSALGAFQQALEQLGLANDVVTFTASDFGRSLRSNGQGTDHAWGTVAMVLGGPVDGGKVFGVFPDLTLDGPDDVGMGGRFLPSTSVDQYFAEMLRWFGVPAGSMSYVLPNITNFWNPNSGTAPLGFMLA